MRKRNNVIKNDEIKKKKDILDINKNCYNVKKLIKDNERDNIKSENDSSELEGFDGEMREKFDEHNLRQKRMQNIDKIINNRQGSNIINIKSSILDKANAKVELSLERIDSTNSKINKQIENKIYNISKDSLENNIKKKKKIM